MADLYAFGKRHADRLVDMAEESAEGPQQRPPQSRPPGLPYFEMRLAKTDGSGITARSGTTAGSGTVTLQYLDDAGEIQASANSADTFEVKNWVATAGAADTYVIVGQDSLGTWWLLNEDCS